jgi:hypothetical protein
MKYFSHKMAEFERNIKIEGGPGEGQLVQWVLHDKDIEV